MRESAAELKAECQVVTECASCSRCPCLERSRLQELSQANDELNQVAASSQAKAEKAKVRVQQLEAEMDRMEDRAEEAKRLAAKKEEQLVTQMEELKKRNEEASHNALAGSKVSS